MAPLDSAGPSGAGPSGAGPSGAGPSGAGPSDGIAPFGAAELGGLIDGNGVTEGTSDAVLGRAFATMRASFEAGRAEDVTAVIQWDVGTPDGPRSWQVVVSEGAVEVAEGDSSTPRVTLGVDIADLLRFLAGRLDGMEAFMSGRLRVSGDLMVAQAMQAWFDPVN